MPIVGMPGTGSVWAKEKSRTGTVPYLMELLSPRRCLLSIKSRLGHCSSERASLVAQSSEGPKLSPLRYVAGPHLERDACRLGVAGTVRAGGAGQWGCQGAVGGAGFGAVVSLLCHLPGVESAFSQWVSFVTSHQSLGETSCPTSPPNLAVPPGLQFAGIPFSHHPWP